MPESSFVQNFIAAYEAGRRIKESQERQQQEREDRETQKRYHQLNFKKLEADLQLDDIRRQQGARSAAIENVGFMEKMPARRLMGAPTSIDAAALPPLAAQALGRDTQNIPTFSDPATHLNHEAVNIPGIDGFNIPGTRYTPRTREQAQAQTMAEALNKMKMDNREKRMGMAPMTVGPEQGVFDPAAGGFIREPQFRPTEPPPLPAQMREFSEYFLPGFLEQRGIAPESATNVDKMRALKAFTESKRAPSAPTAFDQRLNLLLENPKLYSQLYNRPESPTQLEDIFGMAKDPLGGINWELAEQLRQALRPDLPAIRPPAGENQQEGSSGSILGGIGALFNPPPPPNQHHNNTVLGR
jgi:hypothetical protein